MAKKKLLRRKILGINPRTLRELVMGSKTYIPKTKEGWKLKETMDEIKIARRKREFAEKKRLKRKKK
jgi:hypothetical protein